MAKILLVDDSATDRSLFAGILEKESDFSVKSCNDGEEALAAIEVAAPDIVLTDMQMPHMDGLELVTRIRQQHPGIPVILVTGRGSESLATKALRAGAAGYVPKSNSGELLTETVRHVLDLVATQQADSRINVLTSTVRYEWQLENDETLIPGLLQLARQRITELSDCDAVTLLQLEVALEHAILNAIYHGNLEFKQHSGVEFDHASKQREAKLLNAQPPYCDRHVHVAMHLTPSEVRFVVRDEGRGFDVKEVSSLGLTHSLRGEFGHGLFLMWAFMDKVVFDKTGTSATLVKNFDAPKPASETAEKPKEAPPEDLPEVLASLRPSDGGKASELTRKRVTIGREPSCDIVINSAAVSHHHCLVFLYEGWWFVRDLKSKNGIKVNGKQCSQHLLPPAGILSVGPHNFQMEYQPHKLGALGITPPVDPF
jgi:CheY-like chemotaxis protein